MLATAKIPYFTQAILANKNLSINLKAIAIGDGTFGKLAAISDVVTTTCMRQQNQILELSNNVLDVFEQADQRCGFTEVLQHVTYPPKGPISIPGDPEGKNFRARKRKNTGKGQTTYPRHGKIETYGLAQGKTRQLGKAAKIWRWLRS